MATATAIDLNLLALREDILITASKLRNARTALGSMDQLARRLQQEVNEAVVKRDVWGAPKDSLRSVRFNCEALRSDITRLEVHMDHLHLQVITKISDARTQLASTRKNVMVICSNGDEDADFTGARDHTNAQRLHSDLLALLPLIPA